METGDFDDLARSLVHLGRLALSGRRQDVEVLLQRVARRFRTKAPALSAEIAELLRSSPTRSSPFRNTEMAALPVDMDSRLSLLRVETEPQLDVEPVWVESVANGLRQLVNERKREPELRHAGLEPTRTAIFTGPPGVGKSLAARWLARELGWPLLTLDLSAVMSSFLGRTGVNLRNVLDYAKGIECVLLLDELDALAKRRDDTGEIGELKRLVTVLLQEIDDWPATGLLLAATNHPDLVDPAAWRRFEMTVEFPMPAVPEVAQAIERYLGDEAQGADKWIPVMAATFAGRSYSDVERELSRVRRAGVLHGEKLGDVLQRFVTAHAGALTRTERSSLAVLLSRMGYSQRQVHEMTGVSRDTIRRALKGNEAA